MGLARRIMLPMLFSSLYRRNNHHDFGIFFQDVFRCRIRNIRFIHNSVIRSKGAVACETPCNCIGVHR